MSTLKATNIKNVSSGTNNIVLGENGGVVISGLATVSNANVTGGTITGVSTIGVTTLTVSNANITGGSITGVSTIGVTTVTASNLTVNGNAYPTAGPLSNRNLIINGAMQVFQRGTNATDLGATNNVYSTVDRFKHFTGNTAGRFTADAIAVTDLPGFTRALKLSCTTADTSIAADEFMGINQVLEGLDLQQLKKGTSDAEALMMSFYVKGNAAATYTFELRDLDNDRINTRTFDVTTSWVKIEIPLVGDTTGAYDNDNGASLQLAWWLHAGSDYTSGTFANTNTWATRTQANRVSSSNDSFFDSTSRTFFITGVQLEVGSVATPFEHRSYGDELRRCQRYYFEISGGSDAFCYAGKGQGTTSIDATIPLSVPLRASPTMNAINSRAFTDSGSFSASSSTAPTAIQFSANNCHLAINCGGFTSILNNKVHNWGPASNTLTISAEL